MLPASTERELSAANNVPKTLNTPCFDEEGRELRCDQRNVQLLFRSRKHNLQGSEKEDPSLHVRWFADVAALRTFLEHNPNVVPVTIVEVKRFYGVSMVREADGNSRIEVK